MNFFYDFDGEFYCLIGGKWIFNSATVDDGATGCQNGKIHYSER